MCAAVADHRLHSHFSAMGTTGGDGSSSVSNGEGNGYGNGNGSSGFSEEDLLASFGCFAVEGQTERDLATIKSMLSSTNSGLNNAIGRPAGAASFGWPFQTATMQQQQQCLNNPPPNTPTLSKSMDLAGNPPEMQYFGNGFPLNGSGSRRRDVSLDRSYNGSSGNSVTSTGTEQDDTMEDVEQGSSRTAFAGSIRPGMHKRKQSVNMDQMKPEIRQVNSNRLSTSIWPHRHRDLPRQHPTSEGNIHLLLQPALHRQDHELVNKPRLLVSDLLWPPSMFCIESISAQLLNPSLRPYIQKRVSGFSNQNLSQCPAVLHDVDRWRPCCKLVRSRSFYTSC